MEPFLCLIVVVAGGMLVGAWFAISRLRLRLTELDEKLEALRHEMFQRTRAQAEQAPRPPSAVPPAPLPPRAAPGVPAAAPPTATPKQAALRSHLEPPRPAPTVPPAAAEPKWPSEAPPPAPQASRSLDSERIESHVWTRGLIWIAAAALFLAVAFFVKYTFDAGLITPRVRIILGLVFGAALLALAEWLRGREPRIAVGLAAAGVAALFVSILAATTLYHFVSDAVGFVGLAGVSGLAVGLSLRHGPLVAILGLIGGYLTPALIGSPEPRAAPLFGYLLLLGVALAAVARRRGWWWLAPLMLIGSLAWTALWLALNYTPPDSRWLGAFLIAMAAVHVAALPRRRAVPEAYRALLDGVTLLGPLAVMIALGWLVDASAYSAIDWCFMGLLGVATIALARCDPRYTALPWLAATVIAVTLVSWSARLGSEPSAPALATAAALGAALALAAYAALWGAARPQLWATLSGAVAFGYLLLGRGLHPPAPGGVNWGWIGLGTAAAYAVLSVPLRVWRRRLHDADDALTALVTASAALLALGIAFGPPAEWRSLAWGAELAAVLLVAGWLKLPELHKAAGVLAVLCVAAAFMPEALALTEGARPVLNRLLLSHGIPILLVAGAALLARRGGAVPLAGGLAVGALLLAWLLVTAEVRHFFHGPAMLSAAPTLRETGTLVSAWLLMAGGLMLAERRSGSDGSRLAWMCLAGLAGVVAAFFLGIVLLPLWSGESVGAAPVFNALLYSYGLPALLLAVLGLLARRMDELAAARWLGGGALAALFLLITLEVRQAFHGDRLTVGSTIAAEWYAYSLAWVLLGVTLLLLAIATRWALLRWASLIVMLAAVAKVFLSDTAALRDLYRVFSLLGLGASLMVLAWLYQRFVFRRSGPNPPRDNSASSPG